MLSATCFGQTEKPALDNVKKNPTTKENAAKADARLIDKKSISDSILVSNFIQKRKLRGPKSRKKNKTRL